MSETFEWRINQVREIYDGLYGEGSLERVMDDMAIEAVTKAMRTFGFRDVESHGQGGGQKLPKSQHWKPTVPSFRD